MDSFKRSNAAGRRWGGGGQKALTIVELTVLEGGNSFKRGPRLPLFDHPPLKNVRKTCGRKESREGRRVQQTGHSTTERNPSVLDRSKKGIRWSEARINRATRHEEDRRTSPWGSKCPRSGSRKVSGHETRGNNNSSTVPSLHLCVKLFLDFARILLGKMRSKKNHRAKISLSRDWKNSFLPVFFFFLQNLFSQHLRESIQFLLSDL